MITTPQLLQDALDRLGMRRHEPLPGPLATLNADAIRIGPMDCPFPVETPHLIRPDLVKVPSHEPLIVIDPRPADWRNTMAQKIGRLTSAKSFVYSKDFNTADLRFWADQVATALSVQAPSGPVNAFGALPWIGSERPANPIDFFIGLTLSLQEDFVLMAPQGALPSSPGEQSQANPSDCARPLCARLLSVCFPSGWNPEEKCDQSLFAIHQPVADNDRIQKAADALSAAMSQKGPFVRYVYTLAPNGLLWRDPAPDPDPNLSPSTTAWQAVQGLGDIWFRVERQVTIPLAGMGSLFLIRLFLLPLETVLHTPERCHALADALETMSPALLSYKGLDRIAPKIIPALRARAASDRPPLPHSQP
ncbi:MAG: hypothetical protein RL258_721 [Pseudomonadota bacterium]